MNEKTPFGLITTIETAHALTAKGSCWSKEGLLVANYIYSGDESGSAYQLEYTLVDKEGNTKQEAETRGVLPRLFLSPKSDNYVSLVSLEEGVEETVSYSLVDKEAKGFKGGASFDGRFVGCTQTSSIFYNVDIWSEKAQDEMNVLTFKEEQLISENKIAIPLPKDNKVCVRNGEIHIITEIEDGWLHRQIDESGQEIKRRLLEFDFPFVHEALKLSFDEKSYLLCEENGEVGIVEIDADGNGMYGELYNIGDEFFGTWQPQRVSDTANAVQFTTEFGNGWLVIKEDQLIEFVYNKNKKGYTDLLTKETLSIDNNDLVLSTISPISEGKIGIVFYPRKPRKVTYNKVFVLQHEVNTDVK